MNSYRNLVEVERALEPYVLHASKMTGKQLTIEHTVQLAEHAGSPHEALKVIHVAGTSGKTSTCYYTADLLQRAGKKVGLTVSPHMDSIAERVQVNGKPLAENVFCGYFSEFIEIIKNAPEMPTYFELMMVFAMWVFEKEQIDYAVIETGLGGLHDSSNITLRSDKLCVLTDIGYDHMHVLGKTIEEIATQKAGIVKPGNAVVMHQQDEAIMNVVRDYVVSQQGKLTVDEPAHGLTFQQRNWELAYRAYELLHERDDLQGLDSEDIDQSQQLQVPGRMDILQRQGKTIVLDGAHNEQKMSAFIAALTKCFPGTKFPVMMALKQGKELAQIAPLLAPYTSTVIATELSSSQDTPLASASIEADEIATAFEANDSIEAYAEHSLPLALKKLLAAPEEVVVVTGSLYLVAEVRKLLHLA